MKMKKLLFLLPILLGSCAPKVITDITRSYSPLATADKVRLYEVGDSVPQTAQQIGQVKVVDRGMTTRCSYEQVVALAKEETAKSGGNALALTRHKQPSLWSSCHQITGNMLRIDGTKAETFSARSTSSVPASDDCNCEDPSALQYHTFYANIGYAFMTSKFYLPQGATGHPKNGLDWQLGYDWVSKNGFGAGLMYSGYHSSYTYGPTDFKVALTYVAPQFVMKQQAGRWAFEEKAGIGYFNYKESSDLGSASTAGVGYNFLIGAEYNVAKHIGIGANIGYIAGSLPEQDGATQSDDSASGIFRLHLNVGIRYHF